MLKIKLDTLDDTEELGIKLGKILKAGDILCLNGELGAGKTTMTQAIGKGLEVDDYITSPTFNLINEYYGRVPVYHFDVYRLEKVEEVWDLGFEEYFYGNGVSIIEWAEIIEEVLPEERIVIDLKKTEDLKGRIAYITGKGDSYEKIVEELSK